MCQQVASIHASCAGRRRGWRQSCRLLSSRCLHRARRLKPTGRLSASFPSLSGLTTRKLCREKTRLEAELQAAEQQVPALRKEAEAGWEAERKLRGLEQAADSRAEEAEEAVRDLRSQLQAATSRAESQVSCLHIAAWTLANNILQFADTRAEEAEEAVRDLRSQLQAATSRAEPGELLAHGILDS